MNREKKLDRQIVGLDFRLDTRYHETPNLQKRGNYNECEATLIL